MGFNVAVLWKTPEVNPVNRKARSIPILNPVDKYGRVFNFAWFGFMIAFLSWYAFPPLMSVTIKKDLNLTTAQVSNSNIIALTATLLVRLVAGPACDRFGPRYTFAACLLLGSIPTALAGTISNATGLYIIRFFIGILGGSFVPCQVWSTGFFDKNVVGTSNALTGGWGNAGGGITYFVMPAIFDSLVQDRNLTPHVAWRVAFIVPFIFISVTAIAMLLFCEDTPTGKWSERHLAVQHNLHSHGVYIPAGNVVDVQGKITDKAAAIEGTSTPSSNDEKRFDGEIVVAGVKKSSLENEHPMGETEMIDAARGEVIVKPTFKEAMNVLFSLQTGTLAMCYFCSFGGELAINSILGAYYLKNFPKLGQSGAGRWAAMFGLLNVFFRPFGGMASDIIYHYTKSVWGKKIWVHVVGVITGAFAIAIGLLNPHQKSTMFGLVAGMALFMDAGNGANFSLVPHVHPFANGVLSGFTGAFGNFGGIIFAIIFRYNGTDYAKTFWIIGVMTIAINVAVAWIKPIPKGQIGGR